MATHPSESYDPDLLSETEILKILRLPVTRAGKTRFRRWRQRVFLVSVTIGTHQLFLRSEFLAALNPPS